MTLRNKPLDAITEADLRDLIANSVSERKILDYKKDRYGGSDGEKCEYLYDLSSFTNTMGGDLIIGMEESGGVPVALDGLVGLDADAEISRLESIQRSSIAPRIRGIGMRGLALGLGNVALLIRVPRSPISPHMVSYGGRQRFYGRNSNGKYPLDVGEIRTAFELSGSYADRIRDFRIDRVAKILAGETYLPLFGDSIAVLHVVPFDAFDPMRRRDVIRLANQYDLMCPLFDGGFYQNPNFDGAISYQVDSNTARMTTYLQVFRNGCIEIVDAFSLNYRDRPDNIEPAYESHFRRALPQLVQIQSFLEEEPPYFLMLSVLGVKGLKFAYPNRRTPEVTRIDRANLLVPEAVIESLNMDQDELLRPMFGAVWNAGGFERSLNYDASGRWTGGR